MTTNTNNKKIALITGANKGIGFEIAQQLAHQKIVVLIGARSKEHGQIAVEKMRARGNEAYFVQLDVTDPTSIAAAARQIENQFGRLDILVNNVGIMLDHGGADEVDLDLVRRTYETNVFGPFAVTKALLPLLRRSEAGRIVNLTSSLGSLTLNSDPNFKFAHLKHLAYNSSKTALNALTIQLAYALRDTPIKVNAVDPGYTATDFNGFQGTRTVQQGAAGPVGFALLDVDGPSGGFFNENGPVAW